MTGFPEPDHGPATLSIFDEKPPEQTPQPGPAAEFERPRKVRSVLTGSDKVFFTVAWAVGIFVLLLTGSIGGFLGWQIFPTIHHYGFSFFTTTDWAPDRGIVGIGAVIIGTIQIAVFALIIAFPLAFATALYISEYAPPWLKPWAVAAIDLMAAIPSIIYGVWGVFLLAPRTIYLSRWLHSNLGWIPFFHVNTDPDAADWLSSSASAYTGAAFIASICVAMMVIPIACSVMRGVFAQAPIGEREAAYALGATKWGMVRTVVIPFGRGGIIGGTMLWLGRALGETIAVLLIIQIAYHPKWTVLEGGTSTVSALIAGQFGDTNSTALLLALLAAGFVLFAMTLAINTLAAIYVGRGRSGAGTDA